MRTGIILLLAYMAGMQVSIAEMAEPTETDLQRMLRGEVLVQTVHEEKSGGAARVTAVFHANIERVWAVIESCKHQFTYVRGLEYCEVLDSGKSFMKKRHRVNNNWYTPTIDFTFYASTSSDTLGEFHLLEGNLKVMEGRWEFQRLADRDALLVTHEIRIRSRFPAPRWLVRRVLKKDLPDMLGCMRGLAAASGNPIRLADDLTRCPGELNP